MKFANIGTFALAALSVAASPVAQAQAQAVEAVEVDVGKRAVVVGTVIGDVESLLGTLITDIEALATAAGIDVSQILGAIGISLTGKRDEITGEIKREYVVDEKRDLNAVVKAVQKLIGDLLKSLIKLASDAGVSILSQIFTLGLKFT